MRTLKLRPGFWTGLKEKLLSWVDERASPHLPPQQETSCGKSEDFKLKTRKFVLPVENAVI